MPSFAEVIPLIRLPRSLGIFDYTIPQSLGESLTIGMVVQIPFRRRTIPGLVVGIKDQSEFTDLSEIKELAYPEILIDEEMIRFFMERAQDYGISSALLFRSILPEIPQRRFEPHELRIASFTPRGFTVPKSLVTPLGHGLSAALSAKHSVLHVDDHRLVLPFLGRLAIELNRTKKHLRILAPTHRDVLVITHALNQYGIPATRYLPTDGKTKTLEVWRACQDETIPILVGTRAALFLPLAIESTVVLIEDSSDDWKQEEINPRYDARILLSQFALVRDARVVRITSVIRPELFAAIESQAVRLTDIRIHEPPPVTLVDLGSHQRSGNKSPLTETLLEELQNKKCVLLFVSRRGRGSILWCKDCRKQFRCKECDAILSVHRTYLRCPSCNAREDMPLTCTSCQSTELVRCGNGTEYVEEEIKAQFPDAKVHRIDREQALTESLENSAAQTFVIGTVAALQYYSLCSREPLRFDCVAIVEADGMLHRPDFRAHEKLARIVTRLSQIAAVQAAPLVIQTHFPDLTVWQTASRGERTFLTHELQERRALHYPPFWRMVKLVFQNSNEAAAFAHATSVHDFFSSVHNKGQPLELVGPYAATPAQLRGQYKFILLVRFLPDQYNNLRSYLATLGDEIVTDLDPIDVL